MKPDLKVKIHEKLYSEGTGTLIAIPPMSKYAPPASDAPITALGKYKYGQERGAMFTPNDALLAAQALRWMLDGTDTEATPRDRIRAAEIVLDRTLGKVDVQVKVDIATYEKIDIDKLSPEQRDILITLAEDMIIHETRAEGYDDGIDE